MKKVLLFGAAAVMIAAAGCKKKGCTNPVATNYDEKAKKDDGSCILPDVTDQTVELTGNLATRTLTKDKKYLVKGQVFVGNGVTLTVEPGTVVMGDKATKGTLVIERGGKLIADGTAAEPIVFTSAQEAGARDKGDWGGLVILGHAGQNQNNPAVEGITPAVFFGGTNDADNSGILRYVRVEFAGIELTPNNETNSITMGGVGSGTVLEHCQVSFGGDDGFEFFGGTVDARYLISFATWDDDFDVDYGYRGRVQYGLAVRYPSFADQSGSNIFETDNGPNDNDVTPYTTGVFSNITGIGPIATTGQSINANHQHTLDLRRRTALTIANSVFIGMPRGVRMNQASVYDQYVTNINGYLLNNIMHAPAVTYTGAGGASTSDVQTYWEANNTTDASVTVQDAITAIGLNSNIFFGANVSTAYSANPTFAVTTGSAATGGSFTNPMLSTWFTATTFRGAFGATDWTDGWAEFRPISKAY